MVSQVGDYCTTKVFDPKPGVYIYVDKLYLDLRTGVKMEVYVTEVVSPHHFVVQPHGTKLVEIMKAIG